jgi:AcrR family transcriptional regulator
MPKQTFFNLPEDKRKKIIDYALEEFARFDYKTASLSRVVEKAGIAKGSMYQYFENKRDLYMYLIDFIANEKLEHISKVIAPSTDDFFELYKHMILTAARYELSHPRYTLVLYNAGRESSSEELGDIAVAIKQKSHAYLTDYVAHAQQQGQIRKDIDARLAAFVISTLSIYMSEYISEKYGFSYSRIIEYEQGGLPISDEKLEAELSELIKVFKTGLSAPG